MIKPEQYPKIRPLYDAGMSDRQIAEELGGEVQNYDIQYFRRKNGLPGNRPYVKKQRRERNPRYRY